jgi:hypothetical protein
MVKIEGGEQRDARTCQEAWHEGAVGQEDEEDP